MSEPLTWKPGPPPLAYHVGWLIDKPRVNGSPKIVPYKVAYNDSVEGPALYWFDGCKWQWFGTAFHESVAVHCACPWPVPIPAPPSGEPT